MKLSIERVKELFTYEDGKLIRNYTTSPTSKQGQVAGWKSGNQGHLRVQVDGKDYFIHQLVYLLFHGFIPKEIDHKDNNPANNRIENLRECTRKQNSYNRNAPKSNTSGVKNVHWRKDRNKWIVSFRQVNGKALYFGSYDKLEDAALVASNARKQLFGEFAKD